MFEAQELNKEAGPDHWVPVISLAILERLENVFPR